MRLADFVESHDAAIRRLGRIDPVTGDPRGFRDLPGNLGDGRGEFFSARRGDANMIHGVRGGGIYRRGTGA